jgi:hypothetical protein
VSSFAIKNWERFQHYKDRRPPWIKLHAQLLNDRAFMELALASRGLLLLLWILASEDDGKVPYDQQDIAFRLRIDRFSLKDLNPLFSSGFLVPDSECKQLLADASVCVPSVSVSVSVSDSVSSGGFGGSGAFVRPTLDEVAKLVAGRGYHFSPAAFIAHYNSNGWKVGRNAMKSWEDSCTTWEENWKKEPGATGKAAARSAAQRAGLDDERRKQFADMDRELNEKGVIGETDPSG